MELLIWFWNVNGLRAILKKDFMEVVSREKPDILGLQESKLQEEQIPEELSDWKAYHSYWSHAQRKGYSGTALFSTLKPRFVSYGFRVPEFDNEGRIIRAEYLDFILYNIYFPNGQMNDERLDYKLRFYDRCLELMEADRATGKMILVGGDYNTAHKEIDLSNPKENEKTSGFLPIERAWLDKIVSKGWVDTFRALDRKST
ncbi:MAG: exodeoxyribonuclease III, partial [Candidatus Cloacimonetes bacterium]|nr:exodeoxyribonuclease III [Candidatus Cloacimonadota bacterium]